MFDCHVHTRFSNDSCEQIRDICEWAISKKLHGICFTDHVDAIQKQYMNVPEHVEDFLKEIQQIKNEFDGKLKIFSGYEFSEPHKNLELYKLINSYEFDYRMCSIHHNKEGVFPNTGEDQLEYTNNYLREVLRVVSDFSFNALGHVDLPRRYFGSFVYSKELLTQIYLMMIKKQIALEINTSSFRCNYSSMDLKYVELYKKCGGNQIVLGSDAHKKEEIARGFELLVPQLPNKLLIGHIEENSFYIDKRT